MNYLKRSKSIAVSLFIALYFLSSGAPNTWAKPNRVKDYNPVSRTSNALIGATLAEGSYMLNKAQRAAGGKSTPHHRAPTLQRSANAANESGATVYVHSANKTLPCPQGGTVTFKGQTTVDTVAYSVDAVGKLKLNSCNGATGAGYSQLTLDASDNTNITYYATIPAASFSGPCVDAGGNSTTGTVSVVNLVVSGAYNATTFTNTGYISGQLQEVCGSTVKSCIWPAQTPLANAQTYCTQAQ